jgi:hypothetical protein
LTARLYLEALSTGDSSVDAILAAVGTGTGIRFERNASLARLPRATRVARISVTLK